VTQDPIDTTRIPTTAPISRRSATFDLAVVLGFFVALVVGEPLIDPILRHGHGLAGLFALASYQFALEGFAVLFILAFRREHLSEYGFTRINLCKSLALGLGLAVIYDLASSWNRGALLWIPLGRHTGIRMSLAAGLPWSFVGIAIAIAIWGFMEAFFGIFFARKLNLALGSSGRGWLSPGALGFALFNGIIHLALGQGIEGFAFSFASGYAIAVIPAVTGNAWGGALVQTLTNAVGKL